MKSSKSRHGPNSLKRITVACNTGDSLSLAACVHELVPFGHTSWRHIGNESGMRIPAHRTMGIFRQLDDPVIQRFHTSFGPRKAHPAGICDIALRYCFRFHHSHPRTGLKSGKILGCGLCIRFRNRFCNSTHPGVVACPGFEVGHLPFQVLERHTREARRLRMTLSRHQMTRSHTCPAP